MKEPETKSGEKSIQPTAHILYNIGRDDKNAFFDSMQKNQGFSLAIFSFIVR